MGKTHYDVLGLKRGASSPEVRSAYRKLVLVHHPDRSKDPRSKEIFIKITEAYDILIDEGRRRSYDATLDYEEQKRTAKPAQPQPQRQPTKVQPKQTTGPQTSGSVAVDVTRLTMLFSRGQFEEAEKLARRILLADDHQPIPYAVLGDIARQRGELNLAAKMYSYAIQMDPRNAAYQRRYDEVFARSDMSRGPRPKPKEKSASELFAPLVGAVMIMLACAYLALSREDLIMPEMKGFTLGLLAMLFFCGVAIGASLAIGGLIDRFSSTTRNSLGRLAPAAALGFVAIVNFWAAGALYLLLGISQRSFNYSTSRVISYVAFTTVLLSVAASTSGRIDAFDAVLWGGNVCYLGALSGWVVAESFRAA
jgi:curved DNA-binding protein CbpA